jgi:hypothetical protein
MTGRARSCSILAFAALLVAGPAAAGPPGAGVLVPGQSLGGVRLGQTQAHVERTWGRAYGRCLSCTQPTLYFNLYAFRPEGAGVELRRNRVAAIFTLWAPGAWRTAQGLEIGDAASRATSIYGPLARTQCKGYYGLTLRSRRAVTVVYVVRTDVWGFGLLAPGVPVCR